MSDTPAKATREERLAARLRENLHRRKAQSRAMDAQEPAKEADQQSELPKPDASR